MDVKRCAAVVAAAECGTMSAAAKQLGYTPSGIIRLVDALEDELGFAVLVRKTTGVDLTPEGRRMLPLFKEFAEKDEQVRQTAARIRGMAEGFLTIGASYNVAAYWLPPVLAAFGERYPNVKVNVVATGIERLKELLDEHSVDCAVFHDDHDRLNWTPLGRCELVAWVPLSNPLAQNPSLLLTELEGEPFVRIHPADDTYEERLLRDRGIVPDIRFVTDDLLTAFRMVEAGLGCSLCMGGVADDFKGDVKVMPLSPQKFREYGIATVPGAIVSPSVGEFIEIAQEHAGDWPTMEEK